MDDSEPPYQVRSAESLFQIADESGRVVLNSGDRANAEQYAALLNQAFKRGYKAGFRAAKRGSEAPGKRA
jgi:hypothetical protein